jgi:hypothetical protein
VASAIASVPPVDWRRLKTSRTAVEPSPIATAARLTEPLGRLRLRRFPACWSPGTAESWSHRRVRLRNVGTGEQKSVAVFGELAGRRRTRPQCSRSRCAGRGRAVGGRAVHARSRAGRRADRRCPAAGRDPVLQGVAGDPQIRRDPAVRRTWGGLIQLDGLPPELVGVDLAGDDRGSSRFPGRGRIQRVQDQGSRPVLCGTTSATDRGDRHDSSCTGDSASTRAQRPAGSSSRPRRLLRPSSGEMTHRCMAAAAEDAHRARDRARAR